MPLFMAEQVVTEPGAVATGCFFNHGNTPLTEHYPRLLFSLRFLAAVECQHPVATAPGSVPRLLLPRLRYVGQLTTCTSTVKLHDLGLVLRGMIDSSGVTSE